MSVYDQEISFNGKTQTITDWAFEIGLRPNSLYRRIIVNHWSIEKALTTRNFKAKTYNGKTLRQWEKETGIDRNILWHRFNTGKQRGNELRPVVHKPERIFGYWRERLCKKKKRCVYPDCFHCTYKDCRMP